MKIALLSREYPPEVYGGAGVHVEYLARELAPLVELAVHCFGGARSMPEVAGAYQPWSALDGDAIRPRFCTIAKPPRPTCGAG